MTSPWPRTWFRRHSRGRYRSGAHYARTTAFGRRQREEHTDGPTPDPVALHDALATLPEGQRRIVIMHYLADLPVAEIARTDGVPEGTVKSWLRKARTTLAVHLADPQEARHV